MIEQCIEWQLRRCDVCDENARPFMASIWGKRPVVLALVYYECPMLCTQILNVMALAPRSVIFNPRKDRQYVKAHWLDARETPKQALLKKKVYNMTSRLPGHHDDGISDRRPRSIAGHYDAVGLAQAGRLYGDVRARERDSGYPQGKLSSIFLRINIR